MHVTRSLLPLTPERWKHVRALFEDALARPRPARDAFVEQASGEDVPLRDEVLSLLRAHEQAGTTFDRQLQAVPEDFAGPPAAPVPDEPDAPEQVGPWRLLRPLGRGGMGSVYLAVRADDAYRQEVAVKLLHLGLRSAELVRRFRTERQILANLVHPGIARLLDGGSTPDGRPYLTMEYVDGVPIDRYCDQRRLDLRARLRLFQKVCAAVHFAHQNLVVHRDLKPGNVLVSAEGEPTLLDFGIAKMLSADDALDTLVATRAAERPMTPEYASPEQVRGEPITTASDIYALGVILYELLTGRRPYEVDRRSFTAMARAVCEHDPDRLSLSVMRGMRQRPTRSSRGSRFGFARRFGLGAPAPAPAASAPEPGATADEAAALRASDPRRLARALRGDLDTIVLMALRKDPRRRYASAEQLAEDVERHLAGLPVRARPDTASYRVGKFVRRQRAAVAAAGVALVALLAFTATLVIQRRETLRQRQRAEQVSGFLVDVFAMPDPNRARGESVSARQLLDRGAERVRSELRGSPEVQSDLLDTMGTSYGNLGLHAEARRLLEESLAVRRRLHPELDANVAATLQKLSEIVALGGDYARAEALGREALALRRRLSAGRDDAGVAESVLRLGRVLSQKGAHAAAEANFREALTLARRLDDRRTLAMALDRYAILLLERDRAVEAEALLREALPLQRALYGELHSEIGLTLNNLGLAVQRRDYEAAEALFREAAALQRRLYAGPHPHLATTLNNLALLQQQRGRLAEAEKEYQQALVMQRAAYGGDHPNLASTLNNLAGLREAQGRYAEAEQGYREAAAMQARVLGAEHAETANTLNNLAQVLVALTRLDEADTLYRHALDVMRRTLGDRHRRVAAILNNLGDLAQTRGDLAGAERLYREALEILRGSLGPRHADLVAALSNLASLLQDKGDLPAAEAGFREALAIARERLGAQHPSSALTACGLAALRTRQGHPLEAEELARGALAALRAALPADDPAVRATERVLGQSLVAQRRFAEAEPLLLGLLGSALSTHPEGDATLRARRAVIELYSAWGRPAEAAAYRGGKQPVGPRPGGA